MFNRIKLTNEPRGRTLTNRCIELEIEPRLLRFSAWRDEVRLDIRYEGPHELKTRRYPGAFEFDLVIKDIPKTNEFAYDISTKNLTFVKQPELTKEEIANGWHRSDNVIGSYAIYHKRNNNFKFRDGTERNYGSGKFGHIYRPKAIDATGLWTWCELVIEDTCLIIIVPEDFLIRAKYPVTVDPVMGSNTGGASSTYPPGANRIWVYNNLCDDILVTLAGDGTVSNGYVYCRLDNAGAGNTESRMAVWQMVVGDEESSPRVLYSDPVDIDSEIPQWYPYPTLAGSISGGHSFGCGVTFNQYFSSPVHFYYDYMYFGILYGQEPTQSCTSGANTCIPTTLGYWGGSTSRWSVYAQYTEDPIGAINLATGWVVGNIETKDSSFKIEVRSRAQRLQQNMLEVYSPDCRADLGDARCGVDLTDSAQTFWYSGTVTEVTEDRLKFKDTNVPSSVPDEAFRFGLLTWIEPGSGESYTGDNHGLEMEIKSWDSSTGEFELFQGMPYEINVGDEFTVTYGCDKTLATCRDRFNNVNNFRGEPHVPGMDALAINRNYRGRRTGPR